EQTRTMYGNMTSTAQQVAPDFEWNGFVQRNNQVLIDPNAPPRTMSNISFPNQNHRATEPLIAGSLERKGKLLKKYESSFWVITPSRYMHEFKTDDDFAKDPVPETSLYLPDCMIGALDGLKFQVKGKDVSGSSIGNKLSMSHEYAFKAHTPQDATKWYEVLRSSTGTTTNDLPPTSPAVSRQPSASIPSGENAGEPTKVFSEEDTRPQTTNAAALEAERKEAAYAAAGPNDGVATHSKV
ncbi:PH domain-containing protein, partial [Aureobasidium melanogenum]